MEQNALEDIPLGIPMEAPVKGTREYDAYVSIMRHNIRNEGKTMPDNETLDNIPYNYATLKAKDGILEDKMHDVIFDIKMSTEERNALILAIYAYARARSATDCARIIEFQQAS